MDEELRELIKTYDAADATSCIRTLRALVRADRTNDALLLPVPTCQLIWAPRVPHLLLSTSLGFQVWSIHECRGWTADRAIMASALQLHMGKSKLPREVVRNGLMRAWDAFGNVDKSAELRMLVSYTARELLNPTDQPDEQDPRRR